MKAARHYEQRQKQMQGSLGHLVFIYLTVCQRDHHAVGKNVLNRDPVTKKWLNYTPRAFLLKYQENA